MATINQRSAMESPNSADQIAVYSTGNGDARKLSLSRLTEFLATAFTSLTVRDFVKVAPVTVASLPSAAVAGAGARAMVSNANATTFNSVVAGGGANIVPVFSDGLAWRVG